MDRPDAASYLTRNGVAPLLNDLVVEMLRQRPEGDMDVARFVAEWAAQKGSLPPPLPTHSKVDEEGVQKADEDSMSSTGIFRRSSDAATRKSERTNSLPPCETGTGEAKPLSVLAQPDANETSLSVPANKFLGSSSNSNSSPALQPDSPGFNRKPSGGGMGTPSLSPQALNLSRRRSSLQRGWGSIRQPAPELMVHTLRLRYDDLIEDARRSAIISHRSENVVASQKKNLSSCTTGIGSMATDANAGLAVDSFADYISAVRVCAIENNLPLLYIEEQLESFLDRVDPNLWLSDIEKVSLCALLLFSLETYFNVAPANYTGNILQQHYEQSAAGNKQPQSSSNAAGLMSPSSQTHRSSNASQHAGAVGATLDPSSFAQPPRWIYADTRSSTGKRVSNAIEKLYRTARPDYFLEPLMSVIAISPMAPRRGSSRMSSVDSASISLLSPGPSQSVKSNDDLAAAPINGTVLAQAKLAVLTRDVTMACECIRSIWAAIEAITHELTDPEAAEKLRLETSSGKVMQGEDSGSLPLVEDGRQPSAATTSSNNTNESPKAVPASNRRSPGAAGGRRFSTASSGSTSTTGAPPNNSMWITGQAQPPIKSGKLSEQRWQHKLLSFPFAVLCPSYVPGTRANGAFTATLEEVEDHPFTPASEAEERANALGELLKSSEPEDVLALLECLMHLEAIDISEPQQTSTSQFPTLEGSPKRDGVKSPPTIPLVASDSGSPTSPPAEYAFVVLDDTRSMLSVCKTPLREIYRFAVADKVSFRSVIQKCVKSGKQSKAEAVVCTALEDALKYKSSRLTTGGMATAPVLYKTYARFFSTSRIFSIGNTASFPGPTLASSRVSELHHQVNMASSSSGPNVVELPPPILFHMRSKGAVHLQEASFFPRAGDVIIPNGTTFLVDPASTFSAANRPGAGWSLEEELDTSTTIYMHEVDPQTATDLQLRRLLRKAPSPAATDLVWSVLLHRKRILRTPRLHSNRSAVAGGALSASSSTQPPTATASGVGFVQRLPSNLSTSQQDATTPDALGEVEWVVWMDGIETPLDDLLALHHLDVGNVQEFSYKVAARQRGEGATGGPASAQASPRAGNLNAAHSSNDLLSDIHYAFSSSFPGIKTTFKIHPVTLRGVFSDPDDGIERRVSIKARDAQRAGRFTDEDVLFLCQVLKLTPNIRRVFVEGQPTVSDSSTQPLLEMLMGNATIDYVSTHQSGMLEDDIVAIECISLCERQNGTLLIPSVPPKVHIYRSASQVLTRGQNGGRKTSRTTLLQDVPMLSVDASTPTRSGKSHHTTTVHASPEPHVVGQLGQAVDDDGAPITPHDGGLLTRSSSMMNSTVNNANGDLNDASFLSYVGYALTLLSATSVCYSLHVAGGVINSPAIGTPGQQSLQGGFVSSQQGSEPKEGDSEEKETHHGHAQAPSASVVSTGLRDISSLLSHCHNWKSISVVSLTEVDCGNEPEDELATIAMLQAEEDEEERRNGTGQQRYLPNNVIGELGRSGSGEFQAFKAADGVGEPNREPVLVDIGWFVLYRLANHLQCLSLVDLDGNRRDIFSACAMLIKHGVLTHLEIVRVETKFEHLLTIFEALDPTIELYPMKEFLEEDRGAEKEDVVDSRTSPIPGASGTLRAATESSGSGTMLDVVGSSMSPAKRGSEGERRPGALSASSSVRQGVISTPSSQPAARSPSEKRSDTPPVKREVALASLTLDEIYIINGPSSPQYSSGVQTANPFPSGGSLANSGNPSPKGDPSAPTPPPSQIPAHSGEGAKTTVLQVDIDTVSPPSTGRGPRVEPGESEMAGDAAMGGDGSFEHVATDRRRSSDYVMGASGSHTFLGSEWDGVYQHFFRNKTLKHLHIDNSGDIPQTIQRKIVATCILRNLYNAQEISLDEYRDQVFAEDPDNAEAYLAVSGVGVVGGANGADPFVQQGSDGASGGMEHASTGTTAVGLGMDIVLSSHDDCDGDG